ncbi:hypothetical protein [Chondromyces crocatus]|uniref:DUF5050 domain-containing protein n=1 Tax=Chondromyces crocatus TaxID=52 RepID=A0A0K1EEA3_CHOCO|nr:hypothetical protein [Chondromyces crocatus]AKT39196.1 uncharacterized protein CMC5_033450 [Chondromyces crocatus]
MGRRRCAWGAVGAWAGGWSVLGGLLLFGAACAPDLTLGPGAAEDCDDGLSACGEGCVDTAIDVGHCGACGHDCQGGACVEGMCQPVRLGQGPTLAFDVAVDAHSVYWTAQGPGGAGEGAVSKVARDGSGEVTTIAGRQLAPRGLALDEEDVYWVNQDGGAVLSAPKAGGSVRTIASGYTVRDVALHAGVVFWTSQTGAILRAGPGAVGVVTLFEGDVGPDGIALDDQFVYWANRDTGDLLRVAQSGGVMDADRLHSGPDGPTDIALDATHLYWSNHKTGEIMKVPLNGAEDAVVLSVEQDSQPFGIAVDTAYVYWASNGFGQVNRAPIGGGPRTVLASNQDGPRRVLVEGGVLYWTNHTSGELMKLVPPP